MIKLPRIKVRFSLRTLLIAMAVVATGVGLYADRIRDNRHAIHELRARGVLLFCNYFDPIGPDFLYTGHVGLTPNGYLSSWFERRFCTEYVDWAYFPGTTVSIADIDLLRHVGIRLSVDFTNSRMENGTIERLSQTCDISSLIFANVSLSNQDCAHLAAMSALRHIAMHRDGVSQDGLAILRRRSELQLEFLN